jgi:hypothetical protein
MENGAGTPRPARPTQGGSPKALTKLSYKISSLVLSELIQQGYA